MDIDKPSQTIIASCPACGNSIIKPWFTKEIGGVKFNLERCCICKTGYVNPQPTVGFIKSFYSNCGHGSRSFKSLQEVMESEAEFPNSIVDAKRMVKYARKIMGNKKEGDLKALDIGSGYGLFSKVALDYGFKVIAVNPAIMENRIFKELNGFEPIPLFFEEVDFGEEKFDLVILSQVLEHVSDPLNVLVKIKSLLNPEGVVAIAVPNVDAIVIKIFKSKSSFWGLPEHLIHFSQKGLCTILRRAGFDIKYKVYVSRVPYYTISNKLKLHGITRKMVNYIVRVLQWPPLFIANNLEYGLYQHLWAVPLR